MADVVPIPRPSDAPEAAAEWVPVVLLSAWTGNPRKNDQAVDEVAASIKRFGFGAPLLARRADGMVIAGHTRLKAALKLGLERVPVRYLDLDPADAKLLALADNKTAEIAEWDDEKLTAVLAELRAADRDLIEGTGFSDREIERLLDSGTKPDAPDAAAASEALRAKWGVERGQLWRIPSAKAPGKAHRILCGDSQNETDVARLLGDEKPALLSTDPPYCVDYTGMDRPIHDGKPSGKDWSAVYHEVDIKDLGEFLDKVLTACLPRVRDDAAIYIWHAHLKQPVIAATFEKHGLLLHQILVWVKPVATFGHCYYRWRHEPCAFGWRRGNNPQQGYGELDSVWEVDYDGKGRLVGNDHPTQKPLELFARPMRVHTRPGDVCLEPFSGSGTQLVSAEQSGRLCYAMEIEPAFVAVALERMAGMGLSPALS